MRTASARTRRDLAVLEEQEVARVGQQRRDVRGHVVLVRAQADHQRRSHARRDQAVRLVAVHQHERVDALHLRERRAHGRLERARVERLDEVRDDLGVGLRHEAVALGGEARLQREVVLDDAVVDDDDPAAAVLVRVGVLLRRPAVRRPARVPEPPVAGERLALQARGEVLRASRPSGAGRRRRP